jgi:hypothetical protein
VRGQFGGRDFQAKKTPEDPGKNRRNKVLPGSKTLKKRFKAR